MNNQIDVLWVNKEENGGEKYNQINLKDLNVQKVSTCKQIMDSILSETPPRLVIVGDDRHSEFARRLVARAQFRHPQIICLTTSAFADMKQLVDTISATSADKSLNRIEAV